MNIIVISGTKDGREIIEKLLLKNYNVTASVATRLGVEYLKEYNNLNIISGRLDAENLRDIILSNSYNFLVDATHPYAVEISKNAMKACEETNTQYLRFERPSEGIPGDAVFVEGYEQAVEFLNKTTGNILITTGTNKLSEFKFIHNWEKRIIVRTLAGKEALNRCIQLGFFAERIICMNGPFSTEMNMENIRNFKINAMVTKDSGLTGGVIEKAEAAKNSGIPLIVIKRPQIKYKNEFKRIDDVLNFISGERK